MKRTWRASRLHPLAVLIVTLVVCFFVFRSYDPEEVARTVAVAAFAAAYSLQAFLLLTQPEFEADDTGFSFRERRWCRTSRFRRIPFAGIERVRIRGRLARLKLTDGEAVMVKLGLLPRAGRKEVLEMFRELPQYVDDPFAAARTSMSKQSE